MANVLDDENGKPWLISRIALMSGSKARRTGQIAAENDGCGECRQVKNLPHMAIRVLTHCAAVIKLIV